MVKWTLCAHRHTLTQTDTHLFLSIMPVSFHPSSFISLFLSMTPSVSHSINLLLLPSIVFHFLCLSLSLSLSLSFHIYPFTAVPSVIQPFLVSALAWSSLCPLSSLSLSIFLSLPLSLSLNLSFSLSLFISLSLSLLICPSPYKHAHTCASP